LCIFFLWSKKLNANYIHKEMFPLYGGKCSSRKAFHNWVAKFPQGCSKITYDARSGEEVAQTTDNAAVFDALVSEETSVSILLEDMSRNKRSPQLSNVLSFISICDLFTDIHT
jgi:hypothetical protein